MKRKNSIVKRKVKKRKLSIKNHKIKSTYGKFEKLVFKNVGKKTFAVAVSGGSDSLCLAYFSKIYSQELGGKMHALIVNHNLRKESNREATSVKKMLKKKGIESKILNWKGKVPNRNIQFNARNIRYSLISNYCLNNNIRYLLTAHHADDQVENFFIRLFRGSGLTGLSSMAENTVYSSSLRIIRPFLNFKKADLKYVTLDYFKTYVRDPSNKNEKFLRVRIRKIRNQMKKEGLDSDKIIKTINNLLSANTALNFYKNKATFKYVSFLSKNKCLINKQLFNQEASEIVFKSFSDVLSLVSGSYYPPRSRKIIDLINRIKQIKFNKSTLGGCVIEKKDGFVSISKELKVNKVPYQLRK